MKKPNKTTGKLVYDVMPIATIKATFGKDYLDLLGLADDAKDALLVIFPNGKRVWFDAERPGRAEVQKLCKQFGVQFVTK